jgi:hypothetical protein
MPYQLYLLYDSFVVFALPYHNTFQCPFTVVIGAPVRCTEWTATESRRNCLEMELRVHVRLSRLQAIKM